VGGGWPGYPDATTVFPQKMTVDYVRVYQAPDTAERFEATFVDNFTGWKKVILPFSAFHRSAVQPANAPNDGLTLTATLGYRFDIVGTPTGLAAPTGGPGGEFFLDDVKQVNIYKTYLPLVHR